MKYAVVVVALAAGMLTPAASAMAQGNTYGGTASCGPCHKLASNGNQIAAWEKTKHAQAYTALTTPAALDIAKKKGITTAPTETAECLGCHTVTATNITADGKFSVKDGIQC